MRAEFVLFGLMAIWASGLFFGSVYTHINSQDHDKDIERIISFTHAGWLSAVGAAICLAIGFFG